MPVPRLPPLREELALHAGPPTSDGAPTWTLHDPSRNRFFRIGWPELEMLSRWHLAEPAAIAAAVSRETTIAATPAQVEALARFLWSQGLLQALGTSALGRLKALADAQRPHWLMWLLKTYLSFRIPVLRPDGFLNATLPLAKLLFTRFFLAVTVLAALTGGYLALRQWDAFRTTFLHFFSLEGALLAGCALGGAKLLHEFGHAYTAKRYGCRVPTMGVMFLVLWPVLYTDVSEAWKLPSRRQRLSIGVAGIAAELVLAAYATLAWSFLPDGPARSAAFLLATSTWVLTVLVNLNPLMRFDGYFLLSDLLDVPNLQERAFALARWRLRELLFGFGDPPPERWAPGRGRVLLLYAYATWVYRFFLFLGISLLVYHLFFKVLGVFLMAVEIWWFIAKPVATELRGWFRRPGGHRVTPNLLASALLLAAGLAALLVPWSGGVSAPAILRAERQTHLFVPANARLAGIDARAGGTVAEGDRLFRLESPDLDHELAQAERQVETLQGRVQVQNLSPELLESSRSTWRELEEAQAKLAALRDETARLQVRAPFAGVLVDVTDPLATGEWMKEGTALATLLDPRGSVIEAYVPEENLRRIAVGTKGRFLSDDPAGPAVPAEVIAIAAASSRILTEPSLASTYGGLVPTHLGRENTLVPEAPVYRILLRADGALPAPARVERGMVDLDGERESPAVRLWRSTVGVVVRESGF
ncbi:HlyD family efflux transporter periplasmic adaptor subunit [Azospirillum picis]|uniref:Peptide zinc metalloprotease protein n=1 Tax=Azospirillum picis TaxID=488438 RepID=A0ABU0MNB6_9PROT|nr:HlyD family efflux transporter periplasmic adaptor subunit [Azospirillum picis]MBP2301857.1 putative peptide zinc metalloprotease protein [Azospirillum picis]MDQ0534968.1 putative peptide zinc metalloprotease protein [Azospirillum picis]